MKARSAVAASSIALLVATGCGATADSPSTSSGDPYVQAVQAVCKDTDELAKQFTKYRGGTSDTLETVDPLYVEWSEESLTTYVEATTVKHGSKTAAAMEDDLYEKLAKFNTMYKIHSNTTSEPTDPNFLAAPAAESITTSLGEIGAECAAHNVGTSGIDKYAAT